MKNILNNNSPITPNNNSPITPAAFYEDAELQKSKILKQNKGKSGVYRWTNKAGKCYIGSSVNLGRRFSDYFSPAHLQRNEKFSLICRALLKHKHTNFKLEILEYCEKDKAISREQHYLDALPHEYNILETAGSSLGRKHSDETRQKMREARLAYHTKNPAALANLAKIQAAGAAAGAAATSKAVLVKNVETGETVSYISQSAAARALGVSPTAIRDCLKSKKLLKALYRITKKSTD